MPFQSQLLILKCLLLTVTLSNVQGLLHMAARRLSLTIISYFIEVYLTQGKVHRAKGEKAVPIDRCIPKHLDTATFIENISSLFISRLSHGSPSSRETSSINHNYFCLKKVILTGFIVHLKCLCCSLCFGIVSRCQVSSDFCLISLEQ